MDNFIDDCIIQKTSENSNVSIHKVVDNNNGKVDKGKGIMMEDTNIVPNRKTGIRNNGIVIEENVNPPVNKSDSYSDSDRENVFNASMEDDCE
nr:hypothetical protein [Tanacetum cinerariifolium]